MAGSVYRATSDVGADYSVFQKPTSSNAQIQERHQAANGHGELWEA